MKNYQEIYCRCHAQAFLQTRVFKMLAWQAAVASALCFHLYTEPRDVALVSLELAEIHLPLPKSASVKVMHHTWLLCCFLRAGLTV